VPRCLGCLILLAIILYRAGRGQSLRQNHVGRRGGNAVLALRRRRVVFSSSSSCTGRDSVPMRAVAVALATWHCSPVAEARRGRTRAAGRVVQVTMTEFKFDPSTIPAPAGRWCSSSQRGHNVYDLVDRDSSGKRLPRASCVSGRQLRVHGLPLTAGTYTIFCDQPGHEARAEGTLTIT